MNPIVSWVVAHTVARKRARHCPRCGHTQIVSPSRTGEAVSCERCKSSIPAPATATRPGRRR